MIIHENINSEQLEMVMNLKELDLTSMSFDNFEFLKMYTKLQVLKIQQMNVSNLEFLQYLKSLKEFSLRQKAKDENGLRFVKKLSKLEKFEYPVEDMAIYAENPRLLSVGVFAEKIKNIELLRGTQITSVTVCDAQSEEQAEKVIKKIEKYIDLRSSGYVIFSK